MTTNGETDPTEEQLTPDQIPDANWLREAALFAVVVAFWVFVVLSLFFG